MRRFFLALLWLVIICFQSLGQDVPVNFAVWAGTDFYLPITEGGRWGLYGEAYVKRVEFLKTPQGLETSIGGVYYLKNENRIAGGLTWAYNNPYDASSLPYAWPELRIWQQYMIRKASAANKEHVWVSRFRLEERWFERKSDPSISNFDYSTFEITLRCMLRSQWYLSKRFGIALYDEIHLRVFSEERNEKPLDQNRIFAGIIKALDDKRHWRIETGYMFQSQWESPENASGRSRVNHTWRITLTGDIPLKK